MKLKGEFASNVSLTYREDGTNIFTTGGGGDSLTDAGLGNNSAYVDEDVDGFMKLGDIKGEFAGAYSNSLGGFKADALTNGGQEGFAEVEIHFVGPVNQGADVWTNGSAISLKNTGPMDAWTVRNTGPSDYNHGKRSNWDAICDLGTAIKQDEIDLQSDALVQQVNDFAGLINPDSMRPVDFANNQVMFETGRPVEGIGASNPMGIEPNQMMGSISRGDMFAAANELRSDNRF